MRAMCRYSDVRHLRPPFVVFPVSSGTRVAYRRDNDHAKRYRDASIAAAPAERNERNPSSLLTRVMQSAAADGSPYEIKRDRENENDSDSWPKQAN